MRSSTAGTTAPRSVRRRMVGKGDSFLRRHGRCNSILEPTDELLFKAAHGQAELLALSLELCDLHLVEVHRSRCSTRRHDDARCEGARVRPQVSRRGGSADCGRLLACYAPICHGRNVRVAVSLDQDDCPQLINQDDCFSAVISDLCRHTPCTKTLISFGRSWQWQRQWHRRRQALSGVVVDEVTHR